MKAIITKRKPNGHRYAESEDITAVRTLLRMHGFEHLPTGWERKADGLTTGVYFNDGKWSAVID